MRLLRRRELLASGAAALGAGAALPFAADADVLGSATGDLQVLRRLIEIEQAMVLGYEHVLGSGVLSRPSAPIPAELLPHERSHVRILSAELQRRGGSLPPPANERELGKLGMSGRPESSPDAVHYLIGLETIAESAYYGSVARLSDGGLVRLAAEIMACEAQHWTVLSGLLHQGDVYAGVPQQEVTGG